MQSTIYLFSSITYNQLTFLKTQVVQDDDQTIRSQLQKVHFNEVQVIASILVDDIYFDVRFLLTNI